mgnify:CR=1 FL=1|jgi:hypothetical protein
MGRLWNKTASPANEGAGSAMSIQRLHRSWITCSWKANGVSGSKTAVTPYRFAHITDDRHRSADETASIAAVQQQYTDIIPHFIEKPPIKPA